MAARKPKPVDPDDVELQDDGPDLPVEPKAAQFPSLAGDEAGEVEQRTADGPHIAGQFRRTYVLDVEVEDDATALAVIGTEGIKQEAIQRGLRATGDPTVVAREVVPSRRATSTEVTLALPVQPASAQEQTKPQQ